MWGPSKGANSARSTRASGTRVGPGGTAGARGSWSLRPATDPQARLGRKRGLALLLRAPRRPIVFSSQVLTTRLSLFPMMLDSANRHTPRAIRPPEGPKRVSTGPSVDSSTPPRERHRTDGAAASGHSATYRRGGEAGEAGAGDHAVPRSRAGDSSSLPPTRGRRALSFCTAALITAAHLPLALFHFRCTEIRILGDSRTIPRLIVCFGKAQVLGIK